MHRQYSQVPQPMYATCFRTCLGIPAELRQSPNHGSRARTPFWRLRRERALSNYGWRHPLDCLELLFPTQSSTIAEFWWREDINEQVRLPSFGMETHSLGGQIDARRRSIKLVGIRRYKLEAKPVPFSHTRTMEPPAHESSLVWANRVMLAAAVLYFYDFGVTLPTEIELYQLVRKGGNLLGIIFLPTRYFSILYQILMLVGISLTRPTSRNCNVLDRVQVALDTLFQIFYIGGIIRRTFFRQTPSPRTRLYSLTAGRLTHLERQKSWLCSHASARHLTPSRPLHWSSRWEGSTCE
ncbi:hypothetical protein FB45DRAFT_121697 [Roridomyces roridus]|uniref:DUF6533 domain-containing protein n=1 Tax=Roridomyces roridus TaxID=1738132 RepID=A0AAD7FII9_9AGAR|nr:hypothetical protein FB45DRAFT_121697 [Roridomyces roridus]